MGTHHCRRGRRCHTRTRNPDGTWTPGLIETPGLCVPCEESAFAAIGELAGDFRALDAALTEKTKRGVPQIGGTGETPSPLNLGAAVLSAQIETEVLRWYRVVATIADDELPWNTLDAIDRALTVICSRLGTLIGQPPRRYRALMPLPFGGDHEALIEADGVDAVMRLADLHDDAQKVLGISETRTWLAESCHVCGMKALSVSDDQELIKCMGCLNVWSSEQYAALQEAST